MDNNPDFGQLWKQQTTAQPNVDALHRKTRLVSKKDRQKLLAVNGLLTATGVSILFIWYYYQPTFISTKIGISLVILAMVLFLFSYDTLWAYYNRIDATQSNSNYLQNLIAIRKKQQYIQSTALSLYFILLSLGVFLYMYEYTVQMPVFGAIVAYGLTGAWFAFNWFYLRPRQLKKQTNRLNELISQFERIDQQLNDQQSL